MLKYTYFQEIHSFTEILLTFLMLLEQLFTSLLILSEDVNIKMLLLLQHLLYIFVLYDHQYTNNKCIAPHPDSSSLEVSHD